MTWKSGCISFMAKRSGSVVLNRALSAERRKTSSISCRTLSFPFKWKLSIALVMMAKHSTSTDKDLFRDVLQSSATKREARSYLKSFKLNDEPRAIKGEPISGAAGVNLGGLFRRLISKDERVHGQSFPRGPP